MNFYVLNSNEKVMARDNPISRRTALKVTGAAAATALVAGCSDDDDNGDDDNGDDGDAEYEAESGDEIIFFGESDGWEGESPDEIDGEVNPTLILEEGEEYTIGWEEGDGSNHNIEIRDDGGTVVNGYETDEVDEPDGDDQMLEIEATEDMAEYVCAPHENAMIGTIEVE